MGWSGEGMGGGSWLFMGLFWIALIALIIWLVVGLLPLNKRAAASPMTALPADRQTPVEILDRRFAGGELDLESFQAQRAAVLAARGGSP